MNIEKLSPLLLLFIYSKYIQHLSKYIHRKRKTISTSLKTNHAHTI